MTPAAGHNEINNEQLQAYLTVNAKDANDDKKLAEFCLQVGNLCNAYGYFQQGTIWRKFSQNVSEFAQPIKKYESAMGTSPTDEDQLDN
jgi:hypothetical protein